MEQIQGDIEQKIIEEIFPEESQSFLIDYFLNGLFGEEKNFTKGLKQSDYYIIINR